MHFKNKPFINILFEKLSNGEEIDYITPNDKTKARRTVLKSIGSIIIASGFSSSAAQAMSIIDNKRNFNTKTTLNFYEPYTLVNTFCDMDFAGMRLKGSTSNIINQLINKPSETAWDEVIIINNFNINNITKEHDYFIIEVIYELHSKISGTSFKFISNKQNPSIRKNTNFIIPYNTTTLKLLDPSIPPHISIQTAKEYLNKLSLVNPTYKKILKLLHTKYLINNGHSRV